MSTTSIALPPTLAGSTALSVAALDTLDAHPELADRIALLDSGVAHLEALQQGAFDGGQARRAEIEEARAVRSRIIASAEDVGRQPDPAALARADAAIERAVAARAVAADASKKVTAASANSRDAVHAAHALLNRLKPRDVTISPPVELPGAPLRDIVAAERERLNQLDAEATEVASIPMPIEDAIARARAAVLAAAAPPRVSIGAEHVSVELPMKRLWVNSILGDDVPVEVVDAEAVATYLFGDKLADEVEAIIRTKYDYASTEGISSDERRKRLATIAEQRAEAEAIEVAACISLWERGEYIGLRADANPRLLLGII